MPPSLLPPTPEELEELRQRRRASQLKGYGQGADDPAAQALLDVRRNLGELGRAAVGAKPYDETNPTGSYRVVQALMNAPTPAAIIPEVGQAVGKAAGALSGLGALGVIKPKGGNWLADSIKYQLDKLKYHQNPESGLRYAQELFANPALDEATRAGLMERVPEWEQQASLNKWIDTKFNKYVRNEMATPEDPLRALADRGVTLQGVRAPGPQTLNELEAVRGMEGFPEKGMATTESGRNWEAAADRAIYLNQAGDLTRTTAIRDNPWLANLDPKTPVYEIGPRLGEFFEHTGFRHLIDELQAATAPNSTLPQSLRLTPEQLQKVTMPQAVELADKIGKWRASEAAKAEKAGMMENLKNKPREVDEDFSLSFVDKPGGVWVDIPETTSKEGLKLCTAIGKQGGWCTQQESIAKAYGSGDDRLVALLDAEGRPHVQAKISSATPDSTRTELGDLLSEEEALGDQFFRNVEAVLQQRRVDPNTAQAVMDYLGGGPLDQIPENMFDQLNEIMVEAEAMLPRKAIPKPDITELKPVGNMFRNERAQEYARRDPEYFRKIENSVLKFLNNGQWGEVKDLDLYGIVRINPDSDLGVNIRAANAAVPEFVTQRQLSELLDKYGRTTLPSNPPGYKKGGAVKRKASDLPGYGEGSAGALTDIVRGLTGEKPAEPTNPSELFRLAQALGAFPPVAGAVGAVKGAKALKSAVDAPREYKMLQGLYRGYAGDSPAEIVYHAGAEFKQPRPGLFTNPEREVVEQYQRSTGAPQLHTFEARPRRTGTDEDVYVMARRLGIYEPDMPAGQYLEQGQNAVFPESAQIVEELRNMGFDSLRLKDGMGKQPSLVALDPGVLSRPQPLFGSPQKRVADYYAAKRAAQTGEKPHVEMMLVDTTSGREYGHSIPIDKLNREVVTTRARKLKPEDIIDRTQLYRKGGAVKIETNPTLMADELLFKGYRR